MSEKEEFLNELQSKLQEKIEQWGEETTGSIQLPYTLGDYLLISVLGQGGMGTVYEALHVRLDKKVAVKVLSPDRVKNTESLERFARETMAIGKLSHSNIIQALDAREENGICFLVMDYAEGSDLEELAKVVPSFKIADVCEMVRQAADGLQHAFESGLVHRDIKPSNLFLSTQKNSTGQIKSVTLKILDLGLARIVSEGQKENLTRTKQIVGTLDYIAPEQIEESRDIDIRADLYSLGCTLYFLLTHHRPFAEKKSQFQKMQAHVETVPAAVIQYRADIPEKLNAIVMKLLSKKPEDRFSTPAELSDALAPFCQEADLLELMDQFYRNRKGHSSGSHDPTKNIEISDTGKPDDRTNPSNSNTKPKKRWMIPVLSVGAVFLLAVFWDNIFKTEEQEPIQKIAEDKTKIKNAEIKNVGLKEEQKQVIIDEKKYQYALELDGVDDIIETDFKYTDSSPITLEAWVKPEIVEPFRKMVIFSNAEAAGFSLVISPEVCPRFLFHDGFTYIIQNDSAPVTKDKEVHLAAIYDGISISLFMDGKRQGRNVPVRKRHHSSPLRVYIGANPDPNFDGREEAGFRSLFKGLIREVRISKGVLYEDDFQVPRHFKTDAETILHYRFTKNSSKYVQDLSDNHHNGIIHGGAKVVSWKPSSSLE